MSARQGRHETKAAYRARLNATTEEPMQTSGTFPQLSDNTRKTIVAPKPKPFVTAASKVAPKPPAVPIASAHRVGGHAKHTKGK